MTELVVGPAMLRDTVAWLAENAKGLSMADWDLHSHHILAAANQLERALAAPPSPQSPVATQASKERVFRLPAAQELLEARQEIELLRAEVEKYKAWAASCEPAPDSVRAAFKNFHRLLCERFNYLHDEKDWERDQLSLIEWIAERELKAMRTAAETITPQSPVEPVASNERLTLPWRIEWRNSPIADTGDYDCVLSIQASNGETVVDSWNPGHYVEEAFQKIVHAVNAHEWDKRTVETPMPQSPIAAKAPAGETREPQQHYGLGDCGCKECDWFRKHPQCRPASLGGAVKAAPPPGELRAEQEEAAPFTLRDFGYAPGSYSCICFSCGNEFVGDKRAIQCEPCATKKLAQSRAKQPVAHHDAPDDETDHAGRDAE